MHFLKEVVKLAEIHPSISVTAIYCLHFTSTVASADPLLVPKVKNGWLHSLTPV